MKKIYITLLSIMLSLFFTTGCEKVDTKEIKTDKKTESVTKKEETQRFTQLHIKRKGYFGTYVLIDNVTGVEYLVVEKVFYNNASIGITPLYDKNGTIKKNYSVINK